MTPVAVVSTSMVTPADAMLQQDVMDEPASDGHARPNEIGVAVHGGIVTLSGVGRRLARMAAREAACPVAHREQNVGAVVNRRVMEWTRTEIVARLEDRLARQTSPMDRVVWASIAQYKDDGIPLPAGVSQQTFAFLCETTARAERLWDRLAAQDPRIPGLLVHYYLAGGRLADVTASVGVRTLARASQLVKQGINFLWNALPSSPTEEFPFDKGRDFPPKSLRRGRVGRGREATREAALRRWRDPEQRAQLVHAIREGLDRPEARRNMREAQRARYAKPEEREKLRRIHKARFADPENGRQAHEQLRVARKHRRAPVDHRHNRLDT